MAGSRTLTFLVAGICVAATLMLLSLNMSVDLGGYGAGKIFAYHPVFMCLAFLLFMPMGILSYVGDFGERFNAYYPDTHSRRLLHGTFTFIAACLVICGYLVAFVYHQAKGIEHLALTDNQGTWTRPAHVFIGLFALVGTMLQGVAGLYKYVVATRDRISIFQLHGKLGPAVWVAGLVCIGLAAYFEYLEGPGHWTMGQASMIWIMIVTVFAAVMWLLKRGSRDHLLSRDMTGDGESFLKRGMLQ